MFKGKSIKRNRKRSEKVRRKKNFLTNVYKERWKEEEKRTFLPLDIEVSCQLNRKKKK